jgi:2-haloacid dehalogenase
MPDDPAQSVKAFVFDVFGTVVDWHGSLLRELAALGSATGITADWEAFVADWRRGYRPAMQRVRLGELPWMVLDDLHRMILAELIAKYRLGALKEAEVEHLNRAWHRLDPWPDALAGLTRLKRKFIIGTLSNGNVSLLVDMAKRAGLPWDVVFSAELVQHYKPDAEAYRMPPRLLRLAPEEVMLVAAHPDDLAAAAARGLRTGYVPRPLEWGKSHPPPKPTGAGFDLTANDFNHLADLSGA